MNPATVRRHLVSGSSATGSISRSASAATMRGRGASRGHRLDPTGDHFPAKVYARFRLTPQVRQPWEIWSQRRGPPLHPRDEPRVVKRTEAALIVRPPHACSIQAILDTRRRSACRLVKSWSRTSPHSMFARADTLEALAKTHRRGGAAARRCATVTPPVRHQGRRRVRPRAPADTDREGPVLRSRISGHSATSAAGVVVDAQMRDGCGDSKPVPNLTATGEVLGNGAAARQHRSCRAWWDRRSRSGAGSA